MLLRYILFFSLLLLTTLGISPSAGFSGFMPTAPNIGYGGAGKTIASSTAKVVAELGKSAKKVAKGVTKSGAQTLEQRATDIVKSNGGKNSVTIKHSNGQVRVDLAGKSHHPKELGDVPTPHVQNYKNNIIPKGPRQGQTGSITKDSDVLPADANSLRMVDRYLKSQGK